jgi:hypothetical protein
MSAGCKKAGRTKNSPSQKRYKAGMRDRVNAKRASIRHDKRMKAQSLSMRVVRGTARAVRRWKDGITMTFPAILKGRFSETSLRKGIRKRYLKLPPTVRLNGEDMTPAQAHLQALRLQAMRLAERVKAGLS